ncbi:hypothetical protein RBB50_007402 [Rhinocladiella similis]
MLRLVSRLASKPPLRPAISLASASCKARFSDKAVSVTSKTKNALEPAVKHTIIPIEYSCSISFVSEKVADIHKKVQHTYQILILRIRAMARDKFSGGDSSLETGGYYRHFSVPARKVPAAGSISQDSC